LKENESLFSENSKFSATLGKNGSLFVINKEKKATIWQTPVPQTSTGPFSLLFSLKGKVQISDYLNQIV